MLLYFPDYTNKMTPTRTYLLNVVNTINNNSVINAVNIIKKKR